MQVSVEQTSELGRKLSIIVPQQTIESQVKEKLKEYAKSVRVPGFRPGKVPAQVVEQRFGQHARSEVVSQILQVTLRDALKEKEIIPAGTPTIDSVVNEKNADLAFDVKIEIFPEVKLPEFASIKVDKLACEIQDSDTEKAINQLASQLGQWKTTERAAKKGDKLVIDFQGEIDGQPFEEGTANHVPVEIGSERFIAGFEEGLIGLKAKDEKKLDLHFPKDWANKALAGKPVSFTVQVSEVSEKELPEINDEFAKKIGIKDGGLRTLKELIKKDLQKNINQKTKQFEEKHLFDQLIAKSDFPLPEGLVQEEIRAMEENMKQQGIQNIQPELLEEEAKKRTRLSLIMKEIVSVEKIKTNEEKVNEELVRYVSQMGGQKNKQDLLKRMNELPKEVIENVRHNVLVSQATDRVLEQVSREARPISVDKLLEQSLDSL